MLGVIFPGGAYGARLAAAKRAEPVPVTVRVGRGGAAGSFHRVFV